MRVSQLALSAALIAPLTSGCRKIEPAPKELQSLFQFFFTEFEDAEDETMAEAVRNLDGLLEEDKDGVLAYQDGTIDDLSKEDVDRTGYTHADPADAVGLYMVNNVACDMDQMVELVTMKDQVGTYGTYESFDREWISDVPAFQSGEELTASWFDVFHFKSGLLNIDYVADNDGAGRWIPDLSDEETPFGPVLITRRLMVEPADMEHEDHTYPQDWRGELYYQRAEGNIGHVVVMWREAEFGTLSGEDEFAQRTVLNGLKDWDADSDKACEDG